MKRWIAWVLLLCSLLLVACNNTTTDESSIDSNESSQAEENGELNYNVISVGKPYTTSSQPEERYPDLFGQQITDGQKTLDTGVHYTDLRMVGYTANTQFVIDLGEDGKGITGFAARTLDFYSDGVRVAGMVTFAASNDGQKYKTLGRGLFQTTGDKTMSTAKVLLEKPVDYRYVRVNINLGSGAAFFFIDEIEVYGNADLSDKTNYAELSYKNESIDRNAWKALSTGKTASVADSENVAYGKSYKFENCVFDERAPKSDELLTDGDRTGRLFGDDVWVGIKAEGTPSITVDLGKIREDLYSFRLYMLGAGLDVKYPGAIDVYGSMDGKDFTLLGRLYAPTQCDNHVFNLIMSNYIRARYVRFDLLDGAGNYWLEEIEILAGSDSEIQDELYPELNFPIVEEEILWDASEEDYTKKQNLLLGVPQQIAASDYADKNHPSNSHEESPWNATMLTDGKLASDMYCYSSGWFYSRGGNAIDFFYDIGKLSSIESLHISLLEQTDWGITRPKFITVFLSEDGENWYRVGYYDRHDDTEEFSKTEKRLSFDFDLGKAYAARFVRYRIESGATFIDEFSAIGTKKVSSSTKRLADSDYNCSIYYTNPERTRYVGLDNSNVKAKDIALIWGGNQGADDMLLPFVAYLDENGKIKDTFMDGIMYLPGGSLPSGQKAYQEPVKIDWEYLYDTTFNGKNGFDTLNNVVGQVKEELGLTDYKVKVYISILTVRDTVTDFGDVDGDGVSESLATPEGRKKVLEWYNDLCMTTFAERNYQHIEFDGYYWLNEDVTWEHDDSAIITEVGEYVHGFGTNYLWVPYYTANRYFLGNEMGFDVVAMQPNVMFDLEKPLRNFDITALRTKSMNMCVEIEHSYQAFSDPIYVKTYMSYLYYGAVYGYMDAIHIYYDDQDNYAQLARSDDPLHRMQYDATYKFAKGTLEVTPDALDTAKFSVAQDTMLCEKLNNSESIKMFSLESAPEHGTVSIASDGTFRYFPEKGFTGTDKFTYTYNEFLGESESCTVEITVG